MPNEQHFPAWPLITAVISHSPRAGTYTAKVEFPHAPVRILKRSELPPLRREVIAKVQQWTNDEWHKPVRLQVQDPDGRWVLGVPRDGPIVELDTIPPVQPTALRTVSPPSPLPAAAPSARRTPRPSRPFTPRTARQRLSSRRGLRPRALAVGVLALVLAAGAYAIVSSASTPVHARAVTRAASPREAVRASPPATSTTPALTTALAAATTVTRRSRRHATTAQRHTRRRPRAARRPAHGSHRRVVSHAGPAVSAPAARSDTSTAPPPVTSTATAPTATPALTPATAATATPALTPAAAPSPSHTSSGGGCAGTNCLPVPGNGPPPL